MASDKKQADLAEENAEKDKILKMTEEERETYLAEKKEEELHAKQKSKHLKGLARHGSGLRSKYKKSSKGKSKRKKIAVKGKRKPSS